MFHLLPYAEAYRRGEIQQEILTELATGKETIEEIDFELAEQLVNERLSIVDFDSPSLDPV